MNTVLSNLRNRAEIIKHETEEGQNTALRVGGLLVDMLDEGLSVDHRVEVLEEQAQNGMSLQDMWQALAAPGNEQIDASHLINAMTGGLVTQEWVEQNYISKSFFNRLFEIRDSNKNIILPNNTGTSPNNIKALVGLWTNQYLSALGQNSSGGGGGGGGGGSSTLQGLLDVNIPATMQPANDGQVLTYDHTQGKWINADPPATGVTSIGLSVPNGFAVSPSTITTSGTFAITFATGYALPSVDDQVHWNDAYMCKHTHSNLPTLDGITVERADHWDDAYSWGDHRQAGYMTITAFENLFNALASDGSTKINHPYSSGVASIKAMVGLWTDQYLSALGLNSSGGSGGATTLDNLLDVAISNPSVGQALVYDPSQPQPWVNKTLFEAMSYQSNTLSVTISGQTRTVNIQTSGGTITSIGMSVPTGFAVSPATITTSGTFTVSFASGYSLPLTADVAKGVLAESWGDHRTYGYALASNVYSKTEADAKFMTITAFENLFKVYNGSTEVKHPYSGVNNIKALVGLWTQQYLSALGQNSSGGSGGASNLDDLLDVEVPSPSNGQVLMYDGDSSSPTYQKWYAATIQQSGGTVTSITAGNGLTGGTITGTGTIAIDDSVVATMSYVGTALLEYAPIAWVNGRFLPLAGGTMTGQISGGMSGMWVLGRDNALINQTAGNGTGWAPVLSVKTNSGSYELGAISDSAGVRDKLILTFVTDNDYEHENNVVRAIYFPTSEGTLALTSDITSAISSAISDMATKTWANGRFLPLAGGTLTGSLTMKGHDIILGTSGTSSADSADIEWMHGNGSEKARIWVPDVFTWLHGPYYRVFDANGQQIGNTTMLALLTDNVASATKLQTARNLWGNSFDGTADIGTQNSNASLNYVADINMSGNLTCQNVFANENVRLLESGNCWWILGYQAGSSNNSFNILRYDIGQSSITIPLSINKTNSSISMAGSLYVGSNIQESGNYLLMNYASYGLMVEGYAISGTVRRASFGLHTASSITWSQLSGTSDIIMKLITDTNRTFAKKYAQFYDGIRIGDGMIVWDSTNNAFQVIKSDGTAANLYTTGGVSALGMSAGVSSIDAMTFGNLTVNNNLKITKGSYSHNIYGDNYGSLHLDGSEYVVIGNDVLTEGYSIYCGEGSVTAKKFYLGSNRYLYLDTNNVLRYYDNGTSKIIAFS